MVTVHLTEAQARALGLGGKTKARSRKTAGGSYWTICTGPNGCEEEFHTKASENRHVEATKHPRYQLIIQGEA